MKAVEIRKDIYWVGAIDWSMRSFHGYETSRGSSYNAYLILDEKVTLIDTVKEPFKEELLADAGLLGQDLVGLGDEREVALQRADNLLV